AQSSSSHAAQSGNQGSIATAIERRLLQRILHGLGDPDIRFVLWDGAEIRSRTTQPQSSAPAPRVLFRDRSTFYRLLFNADFQFGELYSSGRLVVDGDLVSLLETVYRAQSHRPSWRDRLPLWLHLPHNSRSRARQNIHNHYDIGNDFYKL